jgi:hypothetical protein
VWTRLVALALTAAADAVWDRCAAQRDTPPGPDEPWLAGAGLEGDSRAAGRLVRELLDAAECGGPAAGLRGLGRGGSIDGPGHVAHGSIRYADPDLDSITLGDGTRLVVPLEVIIVPPNHLQPGAEVKAHWVDTAGQKVVGVIDVVPPRWL